MPVPANVDAVRLGAAARTEVDPGLLEWREVVGWTWPCWVLVGPTWDGQGREDWGSVADVNGALVSWSNWGALPTVSGDPMVLAGALMGEE